MKTTTTTTDNHHDDYYSYNNNQDIKLLVVNEKKKGQPTTGWLAFHQTEDVKTNQKWFFKLISFPSRVHREKKEFGQASSMNE